MVGKHRALEYSGVVSGGLKPYDACMIFRRRTHKLPKFPPDVAPTFRSLCEPLSAEHVLNYKREVEEALLNLEQQATINEKIHIRIARELAERCGYLLDHYSEFPESHRALAIGAIRYFAVADDPLNEGKFASGLHDDARVMNYVLEELGIEDRFIEITR